MYGTGYRLDFRDWTIRKTGVLAITTKPAGATVWLNDHKYTRRTPLTLRNMLPATYTMKIESKDYRTFTKQVVIDSNQVTEEHNLDLILNKPTTKVVASDVAKMVNIGSDIIYLNKEKQLMKLSDGGAQPLNLDRLPANVKNVLKSVSDVYLAEKSGGSTWALGVVSAGRKWLVIVDFQEGYRGQLFGAPLNTAQPADFHWIDNDRFVVKLGTTLTAVDLNLNRTVQYTKNVLGAAVFNGKMYYTTRGDKGSFVMLADNNLFDDRPAEDWLMNLPVAKSYDIVAVNDDRVVVVTDNANLDGLWLMELKNVTKEKQKWMKIDSGVSGVWYEHHNLKPQLFYVTGRKLIDYDIAKAIEVGAHDFSQTAQLIGKRGESLFVTSGNRLMVSDTSGANVYEVTDILKKSVWLGVDSKKIWILNNNELTEWTLRLDSGIFSGITNFWASPTASIAAES